jgi:hypothetical protein
MIIKISTGIFIVPFSIMIYTMWPKWTKSSVPIKIMSAPFFIPFVFVTHLVTDWWNNL